MCKFLSVDLRAPLPFFNLHYISEIQKCYRKYYKYLQDDFNRANEVDIQNFIKEKSPYFWVILTFDNKFMGFVFLDNFVGNEKCLYSAELTTCFDKKAWGSFTRYSAKFFLKKCFDELRLFKIKAQIYPDNFRVKNLLKDAGFNYESTLINETLRAGKLQNIEVYSLYKTYYEMR
jgi:RimJ/RimL family protein N-acetyltransferase